LIGQEFGFGQPDVCRSPDTAAVALSHIGRG
jgi:hypothetical protein